MLQVDKKSINFNTSDSVSVPMGLSRSTEDNGKVTVLFVARV